jgi:hypothetical protein
MCTDASRPSFLLVALKPLEPTASTIRPYISTNADPKDISQFSYEQVVA